jgi:cobalt/nickel transport system permease protein
MIDELFVNRSSWIHAMDPRYRVLFATLYSVLVALSNGFPTLGAALIFSIILTQLSRLGFREMLRQLTPVFVFLLMVWIVLPMAFPGEPLFQIGSFSLKTDGFVLAAKISLKSISILTALMALISTMNIATLGQVLHRFKIPDKLVHLLLFTYRYIFVIQKEYQRLLRAAKIRGFKPKTNLHTYRTFAYLIGMIFVQASNRAERVHQAMKCRGFKGKFYSIQNFPPRSDSWIFIAFMSAGLIGLLILEAVK